MDKTEKLINNCNKLDKLVEGGFISKRLGDYTKVMTIIDYSISEVTIFAENGCGEEAVKSLLKTTYYGLINYEMIFDNKDYYKPLFDYAKSVCLEAIDKVTKILEDNE